MKDEDYVDPNCEGLEDIAKAAELGEDPIALDTSIDISNIDESACNEAPPAFAPDSVPSTEKQPWGLSAGPVTIPTDKQKNGNWVTNNWKTLVVVGVVLVVIVGGYMVFGKSLSIKRGNRKMEAPVNTGMGGDGLMQI